MSTDEPPRLATWLLKQLACGPKRNGMNASPPRLATWLLRRLASGPKRESLEGDLVEQYQQHRSTVWFWRQVLLAIVLGAARDIREHKLLAVRAVVLGWATLSFFSRLLTRFAVNVLASEVPLSWWTYHPYYPRGVETLAVILMCIATFSSGWIVARSHRPHRLGMVLAYAVSFIAYGAILATTVPLRISYRSYPYSLSAWAIGIALYSACILLGGLWGVGSDGDVSGEENQRTQGETA
jgi:hypothetical protein